MEHMLRLSFALLTLAVCTIGSPASQFPAKENRLSSPAESGVVIRNLKLPSPTLRSSSLLSAAAGQAAKLAHNPCVKKCQNTLKSCERCINQRSAAYGACGDEPTADCYREAWQQCPDCERYDDCLRSC